MYVVCHSLGMGGVFVCFAFALEISLVYEVGVMLNYKVYINITEFQVAPAIG